MNKSHDPKPRLRLGIPLFGFSLIELMVALAVLSVLVFLALPAFQSWIADTRLSSQSMLIRNVLSTARSEAIKRSQSVRLCNAASSGLSCESTTAQGSQEWSHGMLLFVDENENRQVDPGEDTVIKKIDLDPGVLVEWNRGDSLSFLATGRMDWGSNGTFSIEDITSTNRVHLVIGIQGRVRLQE